MHAFQRSSPWPMELDTGVEGGLIADLQCGGWSTVALSTKGVLSLLGKCLVKIPFKLVVLIWLKS